MRENKIIEELLSFEVEFLSIMDKDGNVDRDSSVHIKLPSGKIHRVYAGDTLNVKLHEPIRE